MNLQDLGWDAFFADAFRPYENDNLIPARVAARHHGPCELLTELGRLGGVPAGKLGDDELPAVGDWVAVRPLDGERKAVIEAVLPRRSAFTRKEAGRQTVVQVVAANVDTVFLVTAFGGDLNPRRLERYLTSAWDSGSTPVIVANKVDVADDPVLRAGRGRVGRARRSADRAQRRDRRGPGRARAVSRAGPDDRAARLVRESGSPRW